MVQKQHYSSIGLYNSRLELLNSEYGGVKLWGISIVSFIFDDTLG